VETLHGIVYPGQKFFYFPVPAFRGASFASSFKTHCLVSMAGSLHLPTQVCSERFYKGTEDDEQL